MRISKAIDKSRFCGDRTATLATVLLQLIPPHTPFPSKFSLCFLLFSSIYAIAVQSLQLWMTFLLLLHFFFVFSISFFFLARNSNSWRKCRSFILLPAIVLASSFYVSFLSLLVLISIL